MLNQRQTVFVNEYLKTGNGSEAYKLAYGNVSDEVARANSSRLLTNANIQEHISLFRKAMVQKTGITIESCVSRIAKLADKAEKDSDKLKALDMLMKHLGGYVSIQDVIEKLTAEQLEELSQKILAHIKSDEEEPKKAS